MKNKKGLSTLIIVLVAIIVLGIGYAVIENITLTINGSATATANDANFKVIFEGATSNSASNQNITVTNSIAEDEQGTPEKQQKLHAVFSVSGMTKAGDYADVTYTVKNKSEDISANLSVDTSNIVVSNSTYFTVTPTITGAVGGSITLDPGDDTTVTIRVTAAKTPIDNNQTSSITVPLIASPQATQ